MTVEQLAYDDKFETLLEMIASERKIYSFDDFRQDVFLEILDCGYKTAQEYKRAARRVAHRHVREQHSDDIERYALMDDEGNTETHEETMSRLIYEGRAVKVS